MKTISLNQTKQWLKTSDSPIAKKLFSQLKAIRNLEIPYPHFILKLIYTVFVSVLSTFSGITRVLWWTPLFKGRLNSFGKNLYLDDNHLPCITGPIKINIGDDCRISGYTTFSGRSCSKQPPILTVGNNVDIGWTTTIAVGQRVDIGNNVRIAGRTILAGYPGHPINAKERAEGLPDEDDQVADIILEDDVWLATNVSVIGGVRIGRGTIVATGSVVTKDLPSMVLAGGIPARVIRHLDNTTEEELNAVKSEQS